MGVPVGAAGSEVGHGLTAAGRCEAEATRLGARLSLLFAVQRQQLASIEGQGKRDGRKGQEKNHQGCRGDHFLCRGQRLAFVAQRGMEKGIA